MKTFHNFQQDECYQCVVTEHTPDGLMLLIVLLIVGDPKRVGQRFELTCDGKTKAKYPVGTNVDYEMGPAQDQDTGKWLYTARYHRLEAVGDAPDPNHKA